MTFKAPADVPEDVCGTFYASKVLGVSVATVQSLVERGELEGWRTKGGHRRITMASLAAYHGRHARKASGAALKQSLLRVLVVDNDPATLTTIRAGVESWDLPLDCTYMSSAMEALMDITTIRPAVLVSELQMPGVDGFEFLRIIRANPLFSSTLALAVTSLSDEEISARGGLPRHTHLLHKPLNMTWLQGFMVAMVRNREIVFSP